MNRRVKLIVLSVAGIAILIGLGYFLVDDQSPVARTTGGERKAASQTSPSVGLPRVEVMKPQRRDMAVTLVLPAHVMPWQQATLYGKVSGYVNRMLFDKGDKVKKGELLARIEAPEISEAFETAKADYKIKQVTYERLLGVWEENPDVIAKQDVDVAGAQAEAAKHLMEKRRSMLEYTNVRAPFSGIITARFADPGALIQAATGSSSQAIPLYTIMDISTVRIYANVPQEQAVWIKKGLPVELRSPELRSPDMKGKTIKGTITRTTEALDPETRTLLVEIDLPNEDGKLLPGMYLKATFFLQEQKHALAIPPNAVLTEPEQGKTSVYVVESGKAKKVPVKLGVDDGVWLEVAKGLSGEERVIVVGKTGLTDGQPVQATPYALPEGEHAKQKY